MPIVLFPDVSKKGRVSGPYHFSIRPSISRSLPIEATPRLALIYRHQLLSASQASPNSHVFWRCKMYRDVIAYGNTESVKALLVFVGLISSVVAYAQPVDSAQQPSRATSDLTLSVSTEESADGHSGRVGLRIEFQCRACRDPNRL